MFITFKTEAGGMIVVNISAIDCLYDASGKYGVLLRSGITYIVTQPQFDKLKHVLETISAERRRR